MEKLPMCRICLVENVRMLNEVNRDLHELYEKLTDIPFLTEDRRPILACFVCRAKLKQCYRLLRKCLKAEELFAQMMYEDYEPKSLMNQNQLEFLSGFIKSPIEHISIVDEYQTESIDIKEELPAVCEALDDIIETKEEHQSDELELENLENSCINVAYIPPHQSESDLEDDVPLMEFKTEVEEEQEVSKKKRRTRKMKSGKANLRRLSDSREVSSKGHASSPCGLIGGHFDHAVSFVRMRTVNSVSTLIMAARKKLSREERLERKREAERLRYQRIKNDPEKYAQHKDKDRQKYERKKETGAIKTANKMTPREQQEARKLWREKTAKRRRRLALRNSSKAVLTPPI